MKIGVISDTHDRLETLQTAVELFKKNQVEQIVHCGDWVSPFVLEFFDFTCGDWHVPVHSVFGNNEGDVRRIIERNAKLHNPINFSSKQTLELTFGQQKVVVYHGQDKVITQALIRSQSYNALFTGHTHRVVNQVDGQTLILNPGSTSMAQESRIYNRASVAIYESDTNTAEHLYL
jgi:uncharacterized protein